jgi:beta-1,4-mannosyl-glycoprotein beta-1,4-N-acetylglucosaminyltransferase
MPGSSAWQNESHQRNAILRGLTSARSNDFVVVSDVDEISNPTAIRRFRPNCVVAHLQQRLFYYAWNNLVVHKATQVPVVQTASKMTTMRCLSQFRGNPHNLRTRRLLTPSLFRRAITRLRSYTIEDAGWHWSYIMTPEEISRKILSFSHTEFESPEFSAAENVRRRVLSSSDPFDREFEIHAKDPATLFPESVVSILKSHFPEFFASVRD